MPKKNFGKSDRVRSPITRIPPVALRVPSTFFYETIHPTDALSSSSDAILYSISLPKLFLLGSLRT